MAKYVHPRYERIRGLDLKNNEANRKAENASNTRNVQKVVTGDRQSIEKRKGYKMMAADGEAYGIAVYDKINATTGAITEELVKVSNVAHTLTESSITIAYTGSSTSISLNIYAVAGDRIELTVVEDSVVTATINIGKGFDEAPVFTLANLKTAIDALTDFSMTIAGDTTVPAASLEFKTSAAITTSASLVIKYWYWTAINTSQATPLSGNNTNKNDSEFENTSFVNFQGNLYISNGYDALQKYDGQNIYNAGLPVGTKPTGALAAGSLAATYKYVILHEQVDAAGNTIQGAISPASANVIPATNSVDLTVTNIEDATGYNTNGAIADGNQTVAVSGGTVTLTVDNGAGGSQTFNAGDTAFLLNRSTSAYTSYAVASVTATTIVLTSAETIQVTDNDPISNNLKIKIYRTKDSGTDYFLVETIPNNFSATTQVYNDTTTDANLGAQFIDPVKTPGLPPKGRYITVFQNQLVIGGDLANVNRYYWSDITNANNIESFPAASNGKDVLVRYGGKITGLGSVSDNLIVFKSRAMSYESGDFAEDDVRSDIVTAGDIGCVAHATIQEVSGSLFFLNERGVYAITGGGLPTLVSDRISPAFVKTVTDADKVLKLKRALAVNFAEKQQYILWLPSETTNVDAYANSDSKIFMFDYFNNEWFSWDNMNLQGGMSILDNELWWVERRYSTTNSDVDFNLYRQHNTNFEHDYADHASAINWSYTSGWEALDNVDTWKKFLRIRFSSFPDPDFEETTGFNITCGTEIDYIRGSPHTSSITINFANQGSGWGLDGWGNFPWGGFRNQLFISKLRTGKAKALRIVLTNSELNTNVLLSGWALEIAAAFRPRTRL
jgi:hypothetical protein